MALVKGQVPFKSGKHYGVVREYHATFPMDYAGLKERGKPRCAQRVWQGLYGSSQCHKPGKFEEEGYWWCGNHCGARMQKYIDRAAKAKAKRTSQYDIDVRRHQAKMALEPTLRRIAEGFTEPRALAAEVLAEYDAAHAATIDKV